jgi:hypothetical protein
MNKPARWIAASELRPGDRFPNPDLRPSCEAIQSVHRQPGCVQVTFRNSSHQASFPADLNVFVCPVEA